MQKRRGAAIALITGVVVAALFPATAATATAAPPTTEPGRRDDVPTAAQSSHYLPITPCRIGDTRRSPAGAMGGTKVQRAFSATHPATIVAQGGHVAGCGIPSTATAIAATFTVVDPGASGYLRAWPAEAPVPTATIVNFRAGRSSGSTATIPLADDGRLEVRAPTTRPAHVVIDVLGYHLPTTATPRPLTAAVYVPVTPCRLADTRRIGSMPALGAVRRVTAVGTDHRAQGGAATGCGIPAGATAATVSVSAVEPTAAGYLRAWPTGQAAPTATLLNFAKATNTTTTGPVPLGPAGTLDVRAHNARTHLVVDVLGYHLPATATPRPAGASTYVPITPCRLADSRVVGTVPTVGTARRIAVTDGDHRPQGGSATGCGIPAGARAAAIAVSAVEPSAAGYLRTWPTGKAAPTATFLNFARATSTTNTGPIPLGPAGTIEQRVHVAPTHVVVDVLGYLTTAPPEPPATAVAIAAGLSHTCGLRSNGTASCWGFNGSGQLGNGTNRSSTTPVDVTGLTGATAIAAGGEHSCAVLVDGTARCWGHNGQHQLGNSGLPRTSSTRPVAVSGLTGVVAVATGATHSCALRASGTVACWGSNMYGQLGNDGNGANATPVTVAGLTGVIAITAGHSHTCALRSSGTVACWGNNLSAQLGLEAWSPASSSTPRTVAGLSGVTSLTAGGHHNCALSGTTVRCWGSNWDGELSTDVAGGTEATPVVIPGLGSVTAVSSGNRHACAVSDDGTVRCWGNNVGGKLGDGTYFDGPSSGPVVVAGLSGPATISAGGDHTCALTGDHQPRCWGDNGAGQIGNGITTRSLVPTAVPGLEPVGSVAVGADHRCAVVADATVRCWGDNRSGRLGDGTGTSSAVPRPVSGLTGVAAVSTGTSHSCAVRTDGTVACWGSNESHQLGVDLGWSSRSLVPVTVPDLTGVVAVATGGSHTCALRDDTTVRCWGDIQFGQVGNGATGSFDDSISTPTPVPGLSGVVQLDAGWNHTCARIDDGTVRCWGDNRAGQAGNGTTDAATTPVGVLGLVDAVDLTVGGAHACARRVDGSVRCWGANANGQLGDGTTAYATTLRAVPGLTATDIEAGHRHTCATIPDTTVRCWGANDQGQLGDGQPIGEFDAVTAPVAVGGLSGVIQLSGGDRETCAALTDATVRCWGLRGPQAVPAPVIGFP